VGRRGISAIAAFVVCSAVAAAPASAAPAPATARAVVPTCGAQKIVLTGTATPDQVKTYHLEPFRVPAGTARIEVGYRWTPVDQGVLDLGLWDATGTKGPRAFRFWSGSRQGRLDKHMPPVEVTPNRDERTVVERRIMPGRWHVEVGYADVRAPLDWQVEVRCPSGRQAPPHVPDPVDPTHVARPEPGWYAGDFHLHAYHSSPDGPTREEMVRDAEAAGLDIIPVTEYVTPSHWDWLGATQRKHPDVLIWPGREVITYFGHMIVLGETPSVVEHRVGYDGIRLGDIQRKAEADGALVSIAHPTIFPPETFGSYCRGCYFQLWDQVDWSSTNLIEVVTSGSVAEIGGQEVPNPFVRTAIEKWESLLRDGHRLTAVSGSDDKSGKDYGDTITMVHASKLSRSAVDEALREGHAYVRGLGRRSPARMDLTAVTGDGKTAQMGDALVASGAILQITVEHADGTQLAIRRDGADVRRVPVTGEHFRFQMPIERSGDSGPLGTFWGAEVLDTTTYPGTEVPVLIANPVFLTDHQRTAPKLPTFARPTSSVDRSVRSTATAATSKASTAKHDGTPWWLTFLILLGVAAVAATAGSSLGQRYAVRRARRRGLVLEEPDEYDDVDDVDETVEPETELDEPDFRGAEGDDRPEADDSGRS
jgi:hypothetical protein